MAQQEPPLKVSGDADRYDHRKGHDDFTQVTALFNIFDDGEKERLYSNVAAAMGGVPAEIIERQCKLFDQVHPDYGKGVRDAVRAADPDKYDPNAVPVTEKTPQQAAE